MATKPVRKAEELTKKQVSELRVFLEDERRRLLRTARDTLAEGLVQEKEAGRDELDESSDENLLAFELRLRDRERGMLNKINKALLRIGEGEYNICEECEAYIGYARLKARPFTTLCINCKEEQESKERQVHDDTHEAQNFLRMS
jgi:DnaK suppressor protein